MTTESPGISPVWPPARHLRTVIWSLASLSIVLVLADPFDLHGIDERIYRVFGLGSSPVESEAPELWTCSMHPDTRQDEPGSCPICDMALVPLKSTSPDGAPAEGAKPAPPR